MQHIDVVNYVSFGGQSCKQVFPGHDYAGHTMSSIGEEKAYDTRIKADTTLAAFITTMQALHLPYPKYIDVALPANLKLGMV